MSFFRYLWLVPALPLAGALLMLPFGRSIEHGASRSRWPGAICSALMAISFLVAVACALGLTVQPGHRIEMRGSPWFAGGEWGLLLDSLSAELMLLVAGIGTLIHIYSLAYMKQDR